MYIYNIYIYYIYVYIYIYIYICIYIYYMVLIFELRFFDFISKVGPSGIRAHDLVLTVHTL